MAPIELLLIEPGGRTRPITVNGLEDLQAAVGGYIEFLWLDERIGLYTNEEAKLSDPPLDANPTATALMEGFNPGFAMRDYIAGPAILLGRLDASGQADGENYPPPAEAVEMVETLAELVRALLIRTTRLIATTVSAA